MKHPAIPYVLPYGALLAFLVVESIFSFPPGIEYPIRVAVLVAILWVFSRRQIELKPKDWAASAGIGAVVFVVWIAPDALFPGYRGHWLFKNALTGAAPSPASGYAEIGQSALLFRYLRAVILVPIIEELFWRAWVMRWLVKPEFEAVEPGAYTWQSFWITALLFAAEHGVYWEVGLLAGLLYNWWMVRTKSLADCIVAHAVTNGMLSTYVVATGKWHYW